MDIIVSPLTVRAPGEPDDALDEVIAKQVECSISQDSPHAATITISKDGNTRRFVLGMLNPAPEHKLSLLVNQPPPCGYVPQPDDPDLLLQCHLPAGDVHLEHLSEIACYIGLFGEGQPATQDYGIIIANVGEGSILALTSDF